jgi:D-alanyl-D-alanine carboxypeptidase (penicillin-binding protein 5/6)
MKKTNLTLLSASLLLVGSVCYSPTIFAEEAPVSPVAPEQIEMPELNPVADVPKPEMPTINPIPPSLQAAAYILIDAQSGKIITQQNATVKRAPASLTKMMTLYVVSSALKSGQIRLDTEVPISEDAWRMGGSKMFVKVGQNVKVRDLIQGIIVDSGNDACVAMAEYLGGNEPSFASMMNQQAQELGMKNSHFTDSTGMPHPDHYTTAQDLAILARALIAHFPEYYGWYKEKWFTYAGIRQPNRNRLLWRDSSVDGIKTGHTEEAGFCLVASAKKDDTRLISVVLGDPSDSARASDSQALLNYGFHFFETHVVYNAGSAVENVSVLKGQKPTVSAGVVKNLYVTLPVNQYKNIVVTKDIPKNLSAPIKKGQVIGKIVIKLNNEVIATQPLVALEEDPQGGIWTRIKDSIRMMWNK